MRITIGLYLFKLDAWRGTRGIGWTLDLFRLRVNARTEYNLVTLIWRGDWEAKMLAFGVLAGVLSFSTHGNFTVGPWDYTREDGWEWNGFDYLRPN